MWVLAILVVLVVLAYLALSTLGASEKAGAHEVGVIHIAG
jgi:hypothetical protein